MRTNRPVFTCGTIRRKTHLLAEPLTAFCLEATAIPYQNHEFETDLKCRVIMALYLEWERSRISGNWDFNNKRKHSEEAVMAPKRRRWFWLLLLLLLIPAMLWNSKKQQDNQSVKPELPPAHEIKSSIPEKQADLPIPPQREFSYAPVYTPVREARLVNYERNAMFILTGRVTSEAGGALPWGSYLSPFCQRKLA